MKKKCRVPWNARCKCQHIAEWHRFSGVVGCGAWTQIGRVCKCLKFRRRKKEASRG